MDSRSCWGKDLSPDLELFAEIQSDRDGRPLAEEVLASSAIQVDHNVVDHDFWLEVNFEESIELKAKKTVLDRAEVEKWGCGMESV